MFKAFREKLKKAVTSFSKKAEEEIAAEDLPIDEKAKTAEDIVEKEDSVEEESLKKEEEPEALEEEAPKIVEEEKDAEDKEPRTGLFSKLTKAFTTTKLTQSKFEELFWDLEVILLENNVAMEVVDKIKEDLAHELIDKPLTRSKLIDKITETLKSTVNSLFDVEGIDFISKAKELSPVVICFVGINGSGKTTTIAKVAHMLKKEGITSVLAASDTFRAAAIDQLQLHADKLGMKLIKHEYGSDAAAVAFDAIEHAKANKLGAVLIDTAGRMHSNSNLIDEMKKIIRVAKPHLKIFVGESITGNDCLEQVKKFDEAIGIDGIILSKADVDEKGGTAVSVSYVTKKPILYIGVGQEYDDLEAFDPEIVIKGLGLD